MRSAWFEHVRKTRRKLSRERKEAVSHREAMSIASTSWGTEKIRYARKIEREKRKEDKLARQGVKIAKKPEEKVPN